MGVMAHPEIFVAPPRSFTRGRLRAVQFVVIHETRGSERATSAEDGASYDRSRTDGVSCHSFVDQNSIATEVGAGDRAHHGRHKGNEIGLGLELCGSNNSSDQWHDAASLATLRGAAEQTARWCRTHGLPVRRLSVAETRTAYYGAAGARPRGIVGHVDLTYAFPEDGGSHTDPGPTFPWVEFLRMVVAEVARLNGDNGEVAAMAKIFKISDGPAGSGALYGSGGSGYFWLQSPEHAQAYGLEWGVTFPAGWAFPTVTLAEARLKYGPYLGSAAQLAAGSKGDAGERGPAGADGASGVSADYVRAMITASTINPPDAEELNPDAFRS